MKERPAQIQNDEFVGIYPEDLFSEDWWGSQIAINNDQLSIINEPMGD